MSTGLIIALILAINQPQEVSSLELLANYKLWKSAGIDLTYDYSGNSRHGGVFSTYVVTDRGLAGNPSYYVRLMYRKFLLSNEYVISYWIFYDSQSYRFWFSCHHILSSAEFSYNLSGSSIFIRTINKNNLVEEPSFPQVRGWNFHTARIYADLGVPGRLVREHYINLVSVHNTILDTGDAYIQMRGIDMGHQDYNTFKTLILYEIWIHRGFSSISELNYLFSSSTSCGCNFNCPTSPTIVCLPDYSAYKNILGVSCSSVCSNSSLSCDSTGNCIPKSKMGCEFQLFDIASIECMFYCPNNSCLCSTPSSADSDILECTCSAGYKKISDNPLACIQGACLEYHTVGYSYVCDTAESGYSPDASGNCCICKPGFSQVSSNPIICIDSSICIGYYIFEGDYKCSSCAAGYAIDPEGKCNQCASGYANVLLNPYTCIPNIEGCYEYYLDGISWKCQTCGDGYLLSEISMNTFICTPFMINCAYYITEDSSLVCKTCILGFYLKEPEKKCFPVNCLAYSIIEDQYACSQCSAGYQIDSDGKCNLCEINYDKILDDPFTCLPRIEHCLSYHQVDEKYMCNECGIEYKLSISGFCDECEVNYIRVESKGLLCVQGIINCLEYEISQTSLRCKRCEEGYQLDLDYECSQCDLGYIVLPEDSSICIKEIPNCLEYELYESEWICKQCALGYEVECSDCAQYVTNFRCVAIPETTDDISDTDLYEDEEEVTITQTQKQRGKIIESSNSIASTTTLVSTMVCMDPNTMILYLNTIQLLSYIQYLNIDLPFEIRKQQSSTKKYTDKMNVLSYINIQGKDLNQALKSSLDDQYSFLSATIYHFILLGFIVMVNILIYYITRYGKGKLKDLGNKLLKYFEYNIYIQIYMLTYLDITHRAMSRLIKVRYM